MPALLELADESTAKKAFAWAIDWPGWCRAGKDVEVAQAAVLAYAPRYADVARAAGLAFPDIDGGEIHLVESVGGGSGTEFGVPSAITPFDRRPLAATEAERFAALVEAAWTVFDRVASTAPPELRKGPRGGGRDRDKMIDHVLEADHAYAREIGVRLPPPSLGDVAAIQAERAAMLDVLRQPTDGSVLADRRWTTRYASRRGRWRTARARSRPGPSRSPARHVR
jgi:hypothetical protein